MIGYPTFNGWSGAPGYGPYSPVPRMPRRRRRALRRIERDLVASDPHLARLSSFLIYLAETEGMPVTERISRWPGGLAARVGRRAARLRRRVARFRGGVREPV